MEAGVTPNKPSYFPEIDRDKIYLFAENTQEKSTRLQKSFHGFLL